MSPVPDYAAHYPTKTSLRAGDPRQCARDLQVWPCEVELARDEAAKLRRRITQALAEIELGHEAGTLSSEWWAMLTTILKGQEDG